SLYVERAGEGANEADGPFIAALARARRRVQRRGGARRLHARRTFCTLSVQARAPTKPMGPYHRSSECRDAVATDPSCDAVAATGRAAEPRDVGSDGGDPRQIGSPERSGQAAEELA